MSADVEPPFGESVTSRSECLSRPHPSNAPSIDVLIDRMTRRTLPKRQKPLRIRRLLLALEPARPSNPALQWAIDLGRRLAAEVHVVAVVSPGELISPYSGGEDGVLMKGETAARRALIDAHHALEKAGLDASSTLATGSPVHQILKVARAQSSDLIILGSHSWGPVARTVLGSTAHGVKQHASGSVLIARSSPPAKEILLPIDGSPLSRRAAGFGLRLARASKTRAHLLHVVAVSPYASEAGVRRAVAGSAEQLRLLEWKRPILDVDLRVGRAPESILDSSRQHGSNLIVMGSRGWGGLRSLVVGGTSNAVAHRAKASVLLVKEERK